MADPLADRTLRPRSTGAQPSLGCRGSDMTDTLTKTDDPIYKTDALIAEDIDRYLEAHQHKTMLRFLTCGSVDDGTSTLIGRLLSDSKLIFEDQLAALESDSRRVGTQGQELDLARIVDGPFRRA